MFAGPVNSLAWPQSRPQSWSSASLMPARRQPPQFYDPFGGGGLAQDRLKMYGYRKYMPFSFPKRRRKHYQKVDCFRPELKFLDLSNPGTMSATGTVQLLSLIPQGTTDITRIGRRATLTGIEMMITVVPAADIVNCNTMWNRGKFWVVVDHAANGSAAVVLDFLASADIDSFRNLNVLERFIVLGTKEFAYNPKAADGNGTNPTTTSVLFKSVTTMNLYIKCCVDIEFSGAAGTIDEQHKNAVYLVAIIGAGVSLVQTADSRIRFVD